MVRKFDWGGIGLEGTKRTARDPPVSFDKCMSWTGEGSGEGPHTWEEVKTGDPELKIFQCTQCFCYAV
eukprot:g17577.t1